MKRILFISHRIPYPPDKGDKIRSFNEIKYLSQNNVVDIVTFIDNLRDYKYVKYLKQYCDELHIYPIRRVFFLMKAAISFLFGKTLSEGYYFSRKIEKKVRELLSSNNYKFAFCYSSQIAQYMIDKNIPKIIDFCDVDSLKWTQYSQRRGFPFNFMFKIEGWRLSKKEKDIYNSFNFSLFSTNTELRIFNPPSKNHFYVLPNGVDYEYFKPQMTKKVNRLVFFGTMDYFANVDAVLWFSDKVFPLILEKNPEIEFYIVGRNPDYRLVDLANRNKNIVVTGYVEDIRPYVTPSKLAVFPLRIARGVQNKILEAMAMEIPVVIPRDVYNTFENLDENDVLIYEDEKSMADIILKTLDEESLRLILGRNLRNYVINYHDWNAIFRDFDEFCNKNCNDMQETSPISYNKNPSSLKSSKN
jgi:sugar transferase (PEP-CTERM/EpsH1 system associated)